jgi:putative transposase
MRIRDLSQSQVSYGYRRLHVLLERGCWIVNHEWVYWLYGQGDMKPRTKKPKRYLSC